ncbi:ABC transporter substrate-binding protein [Paenibacillus swuensis]|uniref:ABC transporter substrate-binding protein n=1 Tax=Paenibacillus swuensis TaxID=1178515 RepID=A0A172TH40_9BACL|nr:ABC transporter substrate-binding protein [Paenibacillus swuensis]ANE46369.1 ABC transporter substrate-binding protein [Paenibacillus swuensis]
MNRWLTSKKLAIVLWTLVLALVLAGCGASNEDAGNAANTSNKVEQDGNAPKSNAEHGNDSAASGKTTYPLTLKDSTGTDVTFEAAPQKIATIAPSETEMVYAVGGGDRVVGVDEYSDYPEEAKSKPKLGDMNTNMEAVLAAKPDVVFAHSSMQSEVIEQLRDLNIKVFASDPKTVDEVIAKVETFGQILDTQGKSKTLADTMRAEKQQVVDAVQGAPLKKVYMEFSPGWTVGSGEYMNELLTLAGGDNVAKAKTGWFEIDPEEIITANPDLILYAKDETVLKNSIYDEIMKRPGFKEINAVKNEQLFPLDNNMISRVGPRLTKVLLDMAKAIHPERVK